MCKPAQRHATLFCSVRRNTIPMVWSQADHLVFGMKWNIQYTLARTAFGRGPLLHSGIDTGKILWDRTGLCPSLQVVEGSKLTYKSPLRKDSQLWMWLEALLSGTWLPPRKSNEIKGIENISDQLHPCWGAASSAYSALAWLEIALDCFYRQYWKSGLNLMLNIVPIKNTKKQQLDIVGHTSTGILWCWWDFLLKH